MRLTGAVLAFLSGTLMFLSEAGAAELQTVVVTGRASDSERSDIAGSLGLVGNQTLELVSHSHINESADRISGVWVSRGNGQEHLTAVRSPVFTGPGSCGAFLVLQDGVPVRPAGFCNVNQLFELNSEQAARLEVFKGPNSGVYGNNALHGVFNVIMPDIAETEAASLKFDAGPHDYARGFFSWSNGESFRIDGHLDHDGGYKHDSGYEQQKVSVRHYHHDNEIEQESFVEMSNLRQETAGYIEGLDAYKDDSQKKANNNPEAYRNANSIHGYSRFSYRDEEGRGWEFTPYANASDMQFVMHWIPTAPLEKNRHMAAGLNGKFFYPLQWFDSSSTVTSGFNLEAGRVSLDEFQSAPTAFSLVQGQHYDFDVDLFSVGIFSELQHDLSDTLSLVAGGRLDYQYYDYNNQLDTAPINFGRYTRLPDQDDDFANLSINTGLLWDYHSDHQLFVDLSTGYRAPQIAELYRLEGGLPPDMVDSVEADSVELGLRGEVMPAIGDLFFYEFAVFAMEKDNVIFKDGSRQYIGDGETSHYGVELTLDYGFAESFYLRSNVSYAEHRYENVRNTVVGVDIEDNIIDTAPRTTGSIQLGYELESLLVELELKHMGDYFLDPEHDWAYEGHELVNIRGRWQAREDLVVTARLMNVSNRDYAERADVSFANLPRYFVGEPRSLYLSVEKTY